MGICVPAAGTHRLIESNHRGGDGCCAGLIRRCSSTLGDRNFILRQWDPFWVSLALGVAVWGRCCVDFGPWWHGRAGFLDGMPYLGLGWCTM